MGFAGIRPAAFVFLRGLASNQNKAWFEENKAVYEREIKHPLGDLATAAAERFAADGIPLTGNPKQSLFRISRDIRFSRDKSPYKTSTGIVWFRPGSGKDGAGVLYFHLADAGCFMAAAFYHPGKDTLDALREGIRTRPEPFLAMNHALGRAKLALDQEVGMTRMPRGYEDFADSPLAPFLKLRDFVVSRPLTKRQIADADLTVTLAQFAQDALPLLEFGWRAVDEVAGR